MASKKELLKLLRAERDKALGSIGHEREYSIRQQITEELREQFGQQVEGATKKANEVFCQSLKDAGFKIDKVKDQLGYEHLWTPRNIEGTIILPGQTKTVQEIVTERTDQILAMREAKIKAIKDAYADTEREVILQGAGEEAVVIIRQFIEKMQEITQ